MYDNLGLQLKLWMCAADRQVKQWCSFKHNQLDGRREILNELLGMIHTILMAKEICNYTLSKTFFMKIFHSTCIKMNIKGFKMASTKFFVIISTLLWPDIPLWWANQQNAQSDKSINKHVKT